MPHGGDVDARHGEGDGDAEGTGRQRVRGREGSDGDLQRARIARRGSRGDGEIAVLAAAVQGVAQARRS